MSAFVSTFSVLYLPAIFALCCLFCLCRISLSKRETTTVSITPFGLLGISIPISHRLAARVILAVVGLGGLAFYGFSDYSSFFPQHLQMEVFFDEGGIARVLGQIISPKEMSQLGISANYRDYRKHYFDLLDSEVEKAVGNKFFSITSGTVHSQGQTSFIVRKLDGFHRYYLQESKGELMHTLDAPHVPERQFFTLFEKLPSAEDYIETSIGNLFSRGSVIIRPRFKQLLAENRTSNGITFNVAVVGFTRVTILPWPRFSPTVYCADLGNEGLVPVAYAIYQ